MASRRRWPAGLRSGGLLLAGLGVIALAAPWVANDRPLLARADGSAIVPAPIPHHPHHIDLPAALSPPSREHWMGTDTLGRDTAARVLHGARVSLAVGLLTALLALLVGVPLGGLAGYVRGWTDASISRVIETVLCFPTLLLALAILAAEPPWLEALSEVPRLALVLAVAAWIPVARYVRGEFIRLAASDMAAAARAEGAGHLRVMVVHLLPSALAPVLVTAAFAVGAAIALEATLSFLGLGVQPPQPTWGGLLAEARENVSRAWWLALFPGTGLFLSILSCNLIGEGLRDLLDPRREPR